MRAQGPKTLGDSTGCSWGRGSNLVTGSKHQVRTDLFAGRREGIRPAFHASRVGRGTVEQLSCELTQPGHDRSDEIALHTGRSAEVARAQEPRDGEHVLAVRDGLEDVAFEDRKSVV